MVGYDDGFRHLVRSTPNVLVTKVQKTKKKNIVLVILFILVVVSLRFIGQKRKSVEVKTISSLQENYEAKITPFSEPGVDTKKGDWKGFSFQYPATMTLYFGSFDKDYFNLSYSEANLKDKIVDLSAVKIIRQDSIEDTIKKRLEAFYGISDFTISESKSSSTHYEVSTKYSTNNIEYILRVKAYVSVDSYYLFSLSAQTSYYNLNPKTVDAIAESIRRTSF